MNQHKDQLTVYKASAGSGKTFRLAVEYIKLLMANPNGFKNILAVTFTNKATEEMKTRILSQLFGIWKGLPDSKHYINEVTSSLGISKAEASRNAGVALRLLIHNYNYFRVETIDSFFQSILRNLARELDLTANLKIGLNDAQVEEQAVDELIESLDTKSKILQWLITYIFSNIDENKSWNVISQIKSFGKTIFQDYYKAVSKNLNDTVSEDNFFENYINGIKDIRANALKKMKSYSNRFEETISSEGLGADSFAGKQKGIGSYFRKLKEGNFSNDKCVNATLRKCLDSPEAWTSKQSPDKDKIIRLANDTLIPILTKAEEDRQEQWRLLSSADVTLKNHRKLRHLISIESKMRELNGNANRFLLSDTQNLLNSLIKGNDTPFIFEKIGCRLDNIMIDEFQDTSTMQWNNFKVLLKECMSHNKDNDCNTVRNLIVGDVKQSIYRWRAGDWRILNNISAQFGSSETNIGIKSLQNNFRSERNVIDFNNAFFTIAAKKEYINERNVNSEEVSDEIKSAYSDVRQSVPEGKKSLGLVRITFLPDDEYDGQTVSSVAETVNMLLGKGVPSNDIAILVRYNKHIPALADYFMTNHPGIKIVSDEAFKLGSSSAVNVIIQALRFMTNPDDILSKASLAMTYRKTILGKDIDDKDFITQGSASERFDSFLPEKFVTGRQEILKKSLSGIIEEIYTMFKLGNMKDQNAYICAFYDKVADFTKDNPGNIESFLEEWEESICNKNVQSDEINGIRLISIHKSKGLEFGNVIIPYCDWPLENTRSTTLWCTPKEPTFNALPIVPVDYSKKLMDTIYADDYRNEHIQNSVDNINLLYVAFTRASKNMFIIGRKNGGKGRKNRSALISECLPELLERLNGATGDISEDDDTPDIFEYGTLYSGHGGGVETSENVFLTPAGQLEVNIRTSTPSAEFRQSNQSDEFINGDESMSDKDKYIKTGNILHRLFSLIRTQDDIESAIRQLEFDGVLDSVITRNEIRKLLSKRFEDERVANWFSPKWKVFNECNILIFDKERQEMTEKRPDRVITDGKEMKVIDFKFGHPREEYVIQVRQYMHLLKAMGYANVRGYLWFVYSNEVKEVLDNR